MGGGQAHGDATPEGMADHDRRRLECIQNRGDESCIALRTEDPFRCRCGPKSGKIDRKCVEIGQ